VGGKKTIVWQQIAKILAFVSLLLSAPNMFRSTIDAAVVRLVDSQS
jgi:hypothetical protein